MEWRIFLRHKDKSYRAFKILQEPNMDLIIIPKNALYLPNEVIKNLAIGDKISVQYNKLGVTIDHYTAHAASGERHVRSVQVSPPHEPHIGHKLTNILKAIPLVTIVASTNAGSEEEPRKKWFGFSLSDDIDYLIFDLVAFPKNSVLGFQQNFLIQNNKKTIETFDKKIIEMRNCNIAILIRSTNHSLCNLPSNILFQQAEGKSVIITRVETGKILAQVTKLSSFS